MTPNDNDNDQPSKKKPDRIALPVAARPTRTGPAYYYGRQPTYGAYGAGQGPGYGYGGVGYGGPDATEGGDSLLGSLTIQRIMRVMLQKWPTLVVAVLLGLGAGFAYYKTAPVVYKTFSVIEMLIKAPTSTPYDVFPGDPRRMGTADEIFNTRLAKMRSREVIDMVFQRVRGDAPNLGLADKELYDLLYYGVEFSLQRRSRLVQIMVKHGRADVAQAIADAYAQTSRAFSIDENKAEGDAAVEGLQSQAETQRRQTEQADKAILDYRVTSKLDEMISQKAAVDALIAQINSDLARAETEEARASEVLAALTLIEKDTERANSLPESVPRAAELAGAQQALQEAIVERDALLLTYTDKHPKVIELNNAVTVRRQQFSDAISRARETAAANLELLRRQTESLRRAKQGNELTATELVHKIGDAHTRVMQLERERDVSDLLYKQTLRRMEEARIAIDSNAASINVIEKAVKPQRPVSPDPRVAFTTGPALGLLLGFIFVLLLDRLEDKITGTSDIEQHMSTKVLTLIPHVPRVKRDELVTMSARKKFSRVAEAFAGLRGILESPRYRDISQVILVVSTQPEEGKTVTSSNLAMTYAMAGKKTLLVDFDLRRPRIARVFKVKDQNPPSLVSVLDKGDPAAFDTLPIASGFENLDLVTSRSSAHISPASIMGSGIIPQFFAWARERYDHVVIDSPPYGLVSDAVVLGTMSDSVLLVCRPDRSRYRAMRHAIRQFLEAGARVLGVVVNDVDFGRSSYFSNYDYHGYGYSYGYRYGKYGRYGGYYKRSIEAEPAGARTGAAGDAEDVEGDERTAPTANVLELDDDDAD